MKRLRRVLQLSYNKKKRSLDIRLRSKIITFNRISVIRSLLKFLQVLVIFLSVDLRMQFDSTGMVFISTITSTNLVN